MAAHLAGVVAAHTTRPVIGVPLKSNALDGMDALLSTVMMPPGIPVATVAIDGAKNAAFLAARIVAGTRPEVRAWIYEVLVGMAMADGNMGDAEARLLDWLRALWGL